MSLTDAEKLEISQAGGQEIDERLRSALSKGKISREKFMECLQYWFQMRGYKWCGPFGWKKPDEIEAMHLKRKGDYWYIEREEPKYEEQEVWVGVGKRRRKEVKIVPALPYKDDMDNIIDYVDKNFGLEEVTDVP